ncbi:nucleotidyltransferase family protein [Ahrensia sp. R2A130]|uniref:nucleotidyltransferase family protein n=1 Tax=Ahrensia sp. R2A130 TaxID=744979 RepID=UPI0001E08C3E|nr:nucleotidyltransferase family protein [Ahrensia sp. R2A130]EFL89548.1 nucleotidyl transferase [Ahrensia sp. R2A130]
MRALLLAAGLGTRLRPITDTIPKCLVPIHGRPLIDIWFDLLADADVERIVVNTHYFADTVVDHVASSPYRDRIELLYEEELLGTAGTMIAARRLLGDGAFLLAHGDNLTTFDLPQMQKRHENREPDIAMTMLAFRTDDPSSCGILETDAESRVLAMHEKVAQPPGNLANAAVYIVEPEVANYAASLGRSFVDFSTDVIPHFMGRIQMVETTGYHRDIGNPESLAAAHREFPTPKGAVTGLIN